jgi:hypothetical protein
VTGVVERDEFSADVLDESLAVLDRLFGAVRSPET